MPRFVIVNILNMCEFPRFLERHRSPAIDQTSAIQCSEEAVLFSKSYFNQEYGNDGEEYILRFKREVRLLTKELQHDHIVSVHKIQLEGSPFWFTMPLANLNLEKRVKANRESSFAERMKNYKQILEGVKYLHEREKFHRDLAPNNILLYRTQHGYEVKIADFDLAKDLKSKSFFTASFKRGYGQEDFTDPQQQRNLSASSHLSDIYSLGALLFYILTGKLLKKIPYVSCPCKHVVLKAMETREKRY